MFQLVDLIVILRIQFWLFQTLIICPVDEMEFSRQCTPLRINENLVSCRYIRFVHQVFTAYDLSSCIDAANPSISLVPRTCNVF